MTSSAPSIASFSPNEGTAYSITLYANSTVSPLDAASDTDSLPPHHLPTFAANVARAARVKSSPTGSSPASTNGGDTPQHAQKLGANSKAEKAEHPLSSARNRLAKPAKSPRAQSNPVPLLQFQNPWPSFRAPGIWDMLHGGLKWGLPDEHEEGGSHGKYKGSARNKGGKQEGMSTGLPGDWDSIEVRKPDWGWPNGENVNGKNGEDAGASKSQREEWRDPQRPQLGDCARATWLGHATTLVQLPPLRNGKRKPKEGIQAQDGAQNGANGKTDGVEKEEEEDVRSRSINLLFDPIFSERCSPSQSAGPPRFTRIPCAVDDLPPIDFVFISHNHYDHLDLNTMCDLRTHSGKRLHAFVPLGNKSWFVDEGWREADVTEMDWWEEAVVRLPAELGLACENGQSQAQGALHPREEREEEEIGGARLRVVCTPAQHGSGRGGGDAGSTLWSSWLVEHIVPCSSGTEETQTPDEPSSRERENERRFRTFFAGDTGLRYHNDDIKSREEHPVCPAFEEISKKFGVPHLLLLPISVGSSLSYFRSWDPFPRRYSPFPRVSEALTSSIHMDYQDAVDCHEIMRLASPSTDANARSKNGPSPTSLAVHYGTFVRNEMQTALDLRGLRKACEMKEVPFVRAKEGRFGMERGGEGEGEGEGGKSERKGADKGRFVVSHQGETVWVPM